MTDNTIANSIKRIVELYNEDYNYYDGYKYIHWTEVETYEMSELTLARHEDLMRYFSQPRFFDGLEFHDNAYEILYLLNFEYDIYIVSIGDSANLLGKKIWIERNIPFATFIPVDNSVYKDKSHIDMSGGILIDDHPLYLRTSNAKKKIVFGDVYQYNAGYRGTRCANWCDVRCFLKDSLNLKRSPMKTRRVKKNLLLR